MAVAIYDIVMFCQFSDFIVGGNATPVALKISEHIPVKAVLMASCFPFSTRVIYRGANSSSRDFQSIFSPKRQSSCLG
jgi:hypothetical protein